MSLDAIRSILRFGRAAARSFKQRIVFANEIIGAMKCWGRIRFTRPLIRCIQMIFRSVWVSRRQPLYEIVQHKENMEAQEESRGKVL